MIKILFWMVGFILFLIGEIFLFVGLFGAFVIIPEMIAKGLVLVLFGILCVMKEMESK